MKASASEFLHGDMSHDEGLYFVEDFYYNLGFPMPSVKLNQDKLVDPTTDIWTKRGLVIPAPLLELNDRQEIVRRAFKDLDFWDKIGGENVYEDLVQHAVDSVAEDPMAFLFARELHIGEDEKDLVVPDESDTYGQLIRSPEDAVEDKGFRSSFVLRYSTPSGELKSRKDYVDSLLEAGQAVKSDEDGRVWVYPITRHGRGSGMGESPLSTPEVLITRLILKNIAKQETDDERWGPGHVGYEMVNEHICSVESPDDEVGEASIVRKVGGAIAGINSISGAGRLRGTVQPPAIYLNSRPVDETPYLLGPQQRLATSVI